MSLTLNSFIPQLTRCLGGLPPRKILVALSGGIDSMCLTHLLAQARQQFPQMELSAATIDHDYRHNSALEALAVGTIVLEWGVDHRIQRLEYSQNPALILNFEEVARNLRYQTLQDICISEQINTVLVAHNLDDCLETFLQRLMMNSTMYGLAGLAARAPMPIPSRSPAENIQIIRPLLLFSKNEIRKYCNNHDVQWFEDLSNADILFTRRNKLRYIINEYAPSVVESRPEAAMIFPQNLSNTINEVRLLVAAYEDKKKAFDAFVKMNDYSFDHKSCTFNFSVLTEAWRQLDRSVLARWLYELASPISSSKHFHWSYAKFERQAVTKISEFLDLPAKFIRFNYVGVDFCLEKVGDFLLFRISKQPPIRKTAEAKVLVNSDWQLFDRTWWFRVRSDKKLYLTWYTRSQKQEVFEAFPLLRHSSESLQTILYNVPVLVDEKLKIVGIPTYDLYTEGIEGECLLKRAVEDIFLTVPSNSV